MSFSSHKIFENKNSAILLQKTIQCHGIRNTYPHP